PPKCAVSTRTSWASSICPTACPTSCARRRYSWPSIAWSDNGLAAWDVVKERGYEGLVAKDAESTYRGGPTRSWIKCKIRREGRFVVGGILGLPSTFAGILIGERRGRRLLWRGTVEWGVGLRTAKQLLAQARERTASPFQDFRLSRGVTWLEPTLHVEVTYSEIMEGRLRDPVYRGRA